MSKIGVVERPSLLDVGLAVGMADPKPKKIIVFGNAGKSEVFYGRSAWVDGHGTLVIEGKYVTTMISPAHWCRCEQHDIEMADYDDEDAKE